MYGIIGKMVAAEGKREPLISILLEGTKNMPGCLNYVISRDVEDANALWITEVWKDQASHQASLSIPSVQDAISKGKPLITGFGDRHIVEPVGGQGI